METGRVLKSESERSAKHSGGSPSRLGGFFGRVAVPGSAGHDCRTHPQPLSPRSGANWPGKLWDATPGPKRRDRIRKVAPADWHRPSEADFHWSDRTKCD